MGAATVRGQDAQEISTRQAELLHRARLVDGQNIDCRRCVPTVITSQQQLGSFSSDARTAMQASPDYFVWWYTVKSVGLCVVAAGFAFMVGRATAKR